MDNKYKEYLRSKEWLEIRLDILQTRKKCERCGSKKCLHVHHKTYKNIYNEEPEDLELLCSKCHENEHNLLKSKKKKQSKKQKRLTQLKKGREKKLREIKIREENFRKYEGREGVY